MYLLAIFIVLHQVYFFPPWLRTHLLILLCIAHLLVLHLLQHHVDLLIALLQVLLCLKHCFHFLLRWGIDKEKLINGEWGDYTATVVTKLYWPRKDSRGDRTCAIEWWLSSIDPNVRRHAESAFAWCMSHLLWWKMRILSILSLQHEASPVVLSKYHNLANFLCNLFCTNLIVPNYSSNWCHWFT